MTNTAESHPQNTRGGFSMTANWTFCEGKGNVVGDVMPGRNDFKIHNEASWFKLDERRVALKLNGTSQYLATSRPIVIPGNSFSVGAWVHLDRKRGGGDCFSAISQGSLAEGGFRLGAGFKSSPQGRNSPQQLHWHFRVSTHDANSNGESGWIEVLSEQPIADAIIGRWVLLVGICDAEQGLIKLVVPTVGEMVVVQAIPRSGNATTRPALEMGRHLELGESAGYWPGGVAEVFVWSGVLTEEEIVRLHTGDPLLDD